MDCLDTYPNEWVYLWQGNVLATAGSVDELMVRTALFWSSNTMVAAMLPEVGSSKDITSGFVRPPHSPVILPSALSHLRYWNSHWLAFFDTYLLGWSANYRELMCELDFMGVDFNALTIGYVRPSSIRSHAL
jgi:hypothetical protein